MGIIVSWFREQLFCRSCMGWLIIASDCRIAQAGIGCRTLPSGFDTGDVVHEVLGHQAPLVVVTGTSRSGEVNQVSRLESGWGRCFGVWYR